MIHRFVPQSHHPKGSHAYHKDMAQQHQTAGMMHSDACNASCNVHNAAHHAGLDGTKYLEDAKQHCGEMMHHFSAASEHRNAAFNAGHIGQKAMSLFKRIELK